MIDNITKIFLFIIALSSSIQAAQGFYNELNIKLVPVEKVQKFTLCDQSGFIYGIGVYDKRPLVIDEPDINRLYRVDPFNF